MTQTPRERALEAALRTLANLGDTSVAYDIKKALRPNERPAFDAAITAARAALSLPPSPADMELLANTKLALAEHAKLYAINADMLAALQGLLDAPDLNLGHLEDETIEAVTVARAAIARATSAA